MDRHHLVVTLHDKLLRAGRFSVPGLRADGRLVDLTDADIDRLAQLPLSLVTSGRDGQEKTTTDG